MATIQLLPINSLLVVAISAVFISLIVIILIILISCLCLSGVKAPIPLLSPLKALIIICFIISLASILFSFSEAFSILYRYTFNSDIHPTILEWSCRIFIGGYFGIGWIGWSSTLAFMTWQKYRLDDRFRIISKFRTYSKVICKILMAIILFSVVHWILLTLNLYIPSIQVDFLWKPYVTIKDRGDPAFDNLKCQLPALNLVIHFIYIVGFLLIFNISHVKSQRTMINLKMRRRTLQLQTIVTLATVFAVFVHVLELVFGLFSFPWVDFGMPYISILIDLFLYLIICIGYILVPAWDAIQLSAIYAPIRSSRRKRRKKKKVHKDLKTSKSTPLSPNTSIEGHKKHISHKNYKSISNPEDNHILPDQLLDKDHVHNSSKKDENQLFIEKQSPNESDLKISMIEDSNPISPSENVPLAPKSNHVKHTNYDEEESDDDWDVEEESDDDWDVEEEVDLKLVQRK